MLAHGLQKAFGWFGGYGWDGTMGYFTGTVGLPAFLGAFIILIETLAALFFNYWFCRKNKCIVSWCSYFRCLLYRPFA